ncbi:MAG: copper amine oxidase N-terminal domain-containing protein [Monoglobales bacterium]
MKIAVIYDSSFGEDAGQPTGEDPSPSDGIKVVTYDASLNVTTTVNFPDQKPVIINGRTLVPVRGLFETLGYNVSWVEESQTAVLKGKADTIMVPINSNTIYKDGEEIPIDVPGQLINSRTMIPLRAISEAFGLEVDWNEETRTVTVEIAQY